MLEQITPLLICFNETANLRRTLTALSWAKRIVIIDSQSTDDTVAIAKSFPNVEVLTRPFDTFADQWNFCLAQATSEWVLTMDADYLITEALRQEIAGLVDDGKIDGYYVPFHYCVFGKPLRATLLPPRGMLVRRVRSSYRNKGHTQDIEVAGPMASLSSYVLHDDRKPLKRWFASQIYYASHEADYLLASPFASLNLQNKIRRLIVPAPFLMGAYALLWKGLLFDGWYGFYYVMQRVVWEIMLSLAILEKHLEERSR